LLSADTAGPLTADEIARRIGDGASDLPVACTVSDDPDAARVRRVRADLLETTFTAGRL
jgi:hypothetical protein